MIRSFKVAVAFAVLFAADHYTALADTPCGQPIDGCRQSLRENRDRARFVINDETGIDRVEWKWSRGEETTAEELDALIGSADQLTVCNFAQNPDGTWVPFLIGTLKEQCNEPGARGCWIRTRTNDFKLDIEREGEHVMVRFHPGKSGRSSVRLVAVGDDIFPDGLPYGQPIRVQLVIDSNGTCWESNFPPNGGAVMRSH